MRSLTGFFALALLAGGATAGSGAEPVTVVRDPAGPITLRTKAAEFRLTPSGEVEGALLVNGRRLGVQEAGGPGDSVEVAGAGVLAFSLDLAGAGVTDVRGPLGEGKRIEARGRSRGKTPVEQLLAIEVYADFPGLAVSTVTFKNAGPEALRLAKVVQQRHRLNASLADAKAAPYSLWSFHGASVEWGQDELLPLAPGFSRPNVLGAQLANGQGGGVPVVAFWTATVGTAVGHLDPFPIVASLPVSVEKDGRVATSLVVEPRRTLAPGEAYTAPRSFLAVFAGDFYEPLRLYSLARQREGWPIPRPSDAAYEPAWCGWGYEFDVTPAEMLGTIPKLKELGIPWATLDDRWFASYGDWQPRSDTFPGDSIRTMVEAFHREGIKVQLWWLPLAVEDGEAKYESHRYGLSDVVARHPDWLVLDEKGGHARMARHLAALCPALPEVRQYLRTLTERFVRDWGFDGHKLDNVFSLPPCYNPAHHHRSPQEAVDALGDAYKVVFETTRALKPDSVTQICPCGTPPNVAWLPYMDQAVTADPVGARQVRPRIKMYKALLGPEAAVYGDHVELSEMKRTGADEWAEIGRDFASTIGPGGVVGTKFTWPDYGPKRKAVFLDDAKEAHWKKWTSLYNEKRLSRGTFLNLYVHGYDVPEGYAVAKDGRMHYAFFAPDPAVPWTGRLELRGLAPGRYAVRDYVEGRDLGVVEGGRPFLDASFTGHLLVEAVPAP
ncbi:MAG TPA: alpha-galactosidase [Vicinamibacteria bacterium]|nr:alpha-galactosidase [Vicinamibacteria bacterium]